MKISYLKYFFVLISLSVSMNVIAEETSSEQFEWETALSKRTSEQMINTIKSDKLKSFNKTNRLGSITGIEYYFSTERGDRYKVTYSSPSQDCVVYVDVSYTTNKVNEIVGFDCKKDGN